MGNRSSSTAATDARKEAELMGGKVDLSRGLELDFSTLALQHLPKSLGDLSKLKTLNCTLCESLSSLPASIGDCKKLQTLICNLCSKLEGLPSSIGDCKWLQSLECRECTSLTRKLY